ncbi:hypothetical protein LEL_05723 [Akanthomyces lecanii RCEF 1005]|uniref:Uncharacterized protein n=1 Tax=Akanthomyces lecanii RCEF 1005 TaxID=1081108 RepID=A0A162N5X1_CORDF|nr:hypothetical protein LEL_05723 [Akanthomyces lecanii RCEF 1005]
MGLGHLPMHVRRRVGDYEAWARFQGLTTQVLRLELQELQETEDVSQSVVDGSDWIFVSDPAPLDGASRDTLHKRFVPWVAEERRGRRCQGEGGQGEK